MMNAPTPEITAPKPRDGMSARFGESLVSRLLLNRHDLGVALAHSDQRHVPLVDAVVELGFVSEIDSYVALSMFTGLRLVELCDMTPSNLALRLVPERVARRHQLLPLTEDNRLLTYATSHPYNDEAERDVAFASGRTSVAVVARRSELLIALERCYHNLSDIDLLLARVRSEAHVELVEGGDTNTLTESPIIDLCNHIVARAVEAKASDVHIEPYEKRFRIRSCNDGI